MGSEPPDTGTPSLENRGPPAIIANGQLIDTQKWTISVSFLQIWASEPLCVCVCVCLSFRKKLIFCVSAFQGTTWHQVCINLATHKCIHNRLHFFPWNKRSPRHAISVRENAPIMRLIYRWCKQGWSFVMPSDVWRWPIKCNIMSQVVNYPQQGSNVRSVAISPLMGRSLISLIMHAVVSQHAAYFAPYISP